MNEETTFLQERQTIDDILCEHRREEFFVIVGGSTYEEDEKLLLDLHQLLVSKRWENNKTPKKVLSILAPRKMEHVGSLERNVEKRGLKAFRWSSTTNMDNSSSDEIRKRMPRDTDVLLIDTVGILCLFYENADCIYVGGGLTPASVGGHNFMEALNAKYSSSRPMTVFTGSCLSSNMEAMLEVLEKHGCEVPHQVSKGSNCGARELYDALDASVRKNGKYSAESMATKGNVQSVQEVLIENVVADLKLSKVIL